MNVGVLIILLIVLFAVSCMAVEAIIENDFVEAIFLCASTIVMIVLISVEHANRVKKLETFGTYPDTTILIKKGVQDTSIIYKVKERE